MTHSVPPSPNMPPKLPRLLRVALILALGVLGWVLPLLGLAMVLRHPLASLLWVLLLLGLVAMLYPLPEPLLRLRHLLTRMRLRLQRRRVLKQLRRLPLSL